MRFMTCRAKDTAGTASTEPVSISRLSLRLRDSEKASTLQCRSFFPAQGYPESAHRKNRVAIITYPHSDSDQFESVNAAPAFVNEI